MVGRHRGQHADTMTAQLFDLIARRARGDLAVALVAAAPVRYVPPTFLLALECIDPGDLRAWARPASVTPLQPVVEAR